MNKVLLASALVALTFSAQAQTIADFESPVLPKADTAYINYTDFGNDVGFQSGLAYFPCVYAGTAGSEYWSYGFAYSNYSDTVTSGYTNQYAAKTGEGFASSSQYAVAYGSRNIVKLVDAAQGKTVDGVYLTNNTYAYNSMRDGDGFSKQFTHSDKDFFKVDIFGYLGGTKKSDSVTFYLADFTQTDAADNYIINDWQWVSLRKIGDVDSLEFMLSSSDVGSFGMNTPAYFCLDNLITDETGVSITETNKNIALKIYPNPSSNNITLESNLNNPYEITIVDFQGRIVGAQKISNAIEAVSIAHLANGVYILNIKSEDKTAQTRFVKQ